MTLIENKVYRIISEQLGIPESSISLEKRFVDDLGGDSLDTVEMMLTLEDEFDIVLPEEEVENFITVQDVMDYLNSLELS
jgi:acyl carrier protein